MTEQGWVLSCERQCALQTRDSRPGHTVGTRAAGVSGSPPESPVQALIPQGWRLLPGHTAPEVEMGHAEQVRALSRRPGGSRVTGAQGWVGGP